MNVNSYIFQSPYSSQIQIGRPDTTATKSTTAEVSSKSGQTQAKDIPSFDNTKTQKTNESVKETLTSNSTLDMYA